MAGNDDHAGVADAQAAPMIAPAGRNAAPQLTDRGDESAKYTAPRLNLKITDFDVLAIMGEGSLSTVVKALWRDCQQVYAIKIIDKVYIARKGMLDSVIRERAVMDAVRSDLCVRLCFTFQDAQKLYLGMDLCPNGDLFDQIQARKPLPSAAAQFYAAEIVLILEYLRSARILFRDLKPENLLLTASGHLKLADFGSAKFSPTNDDASPAPAASPTSTSRAMSGPSASSSTHLSANSSRSDAAAASLSHPVPSPAILHPATATTAAPPIRSPGAATAAPETAKPAGQLGAGGHAAGAANGTAADVSAASSDFQGEAGHSVAAAQARAARRTPPKRAVSFVGTADYLAPEVLSNTSCTHGVDLWGFGCVLYQLLFGKPPFRDKSEYLTMQRISEHAFTIPESCPPAARDLLEKLLRQEPAERIGYASVQEIKDHIYFQGVDWATLRDQDAPAFKAKAVSDDVEGDRWEMESMMAGLPLPGH